MFFHRTARNSVRRNERGLVKLFAYASAARSSRSTNIPLMTCMQDYTKPVTELATILITSSNFKDIDTESRTLGLERSSEPHVAYSAATVDRDQVEFMQDDPSSYYYEQMKQPDRSFGEFHAIFGTLKGQGLIERYSVYRRVTIDKQGEPAPHQEHTIGAELAVADIRVGKDLNGHKGIVHGGIISLLIDDTFGWVRGHGEIEWEIFWR